MPIGTPRPPLRCCLHVQTSVLPMTPNDPNNRDPLNPEPDRPSYPMSGPTNYGTWLIGGILGAILIIGVAFVMNRNATTGIASDSTRPAPTTTGSGGTVPLPESGQGTAGNAKQTVPAPR